LKIQHKVDSTIIFSLNEIIISGRVFGLFK